MWCKAHAEVKIKDTGDIFISNENGYYSSKEMAIGCLTSLVHTIFKKQYIEELAIITTPVQQNNENM